MNAPLSLKKPPGTGVEQLVVNLHWSTANVNLIVDGGQNLSHSLIVSKDAKAIISGNISPVQQLGNSWSKRIELPDHTWDQPRLNSVTPMTFLFLETVEAINIPVSNVTTLHLTRTGQGVTLLNPSFYEPDKAFKYLNEVLHLLTLPALDEFFRDKNTGKLKTEWTFVVDNGPAEQPSSPLVQMCLVRLLNFLKLHKIKQVSFAEYHSKRNFVERVHAEENRVLSKHGPFSKVVYPKASTGSKEHRANMERMTKEIRGCIIQGSFGGRPLHAFRGVKHCNFIFTDQNELHTFLDLNEQGKMQFCPAKYTANGGEMLTTLHMLWEVDEEFEGEYMRDYQTLHNELTEEGRTAWLDKYTTALYSAKEDVRRYELQPIPDYLRWFKTSELHYLPLEERMLLLGPWDDIPSVYLPSKVWNLCFNIFQHPSDDIIHLISLLSWTTPQEV